MKMQFTKEIEDFGPIFPFYPEIMIFTEDEYVIMNTTLRIKREDKWYDILVREEYKNNPNFITDFTPIFKDVLMTNYLFFNVPNSINPSKNQIETIYEEFENIDWQNRIKNEETLNMCK